MQLKLEFKKKSDCHLVFVFVFALLPLAGAPVGPECSRLQRRRLTVGLRFLPRGLRFLRFQPLGGLGVPLAHGGQRVEEPLRVQRVLVAAVPRRLRGVPVARLLGRPDSGRLGGRLAGEVGDAGLLAGQGVGVVLRQGGLGAVRRGRVGGVA